MERFGFVGLPNAGKSSLYNALAGGGALAAPYAFATVDPNVGVAKVPDDRLDRLAAMSASRNVVPAAVQFVDIAGLVKGAAQGEGLGNRFLSHIREVDAVVFVLRAFEDTDVPGSADPVEQLDTLEVELVYADLETVEKQVEKRRKAARGGRTPSWPGGGPRSRGPSTGCVPACPCTAPTWTSRVASCSGRTSSSPTSGPWRW
jgi:ribosome-binding ATPase YchF (GTP1/OBG family)